MIADTPEGLSATEVGKEIGEHARHVEREAAASIHRHGHALSIAEAVLLSVVALTAAWSGYAAAKWSTEASLKLAKASATRTKANRAYQGSLTLRSQDAANFNVWFTAYLLKSLQGEQARGPTPTTPKARMPLSPVTGTSAPL